jgi:hypothetical protein
MTSIGYFDVNRNIRISQEAYEMILNKYANNYLIIDESEKITAKNDKLSLSEKKNDINQAISQDEMTSKLSLDTATIEKENSQNLIKEQKPEINELANEGGVEGLLLFSLDDNTESSVNSLSYKSNEISNSTDLKIDSINHLLKNERFHY